MVLRAGDGIILTPKLQQQTHQTRGIITDVLKSFVTPDVIVVTYRVEVEVESVCFSLYMDADYRRDGEGDPIGTNPVSNGSIGLAVAFTSATQHGPTGLRPIQPIGVTYRD